MEHFTPAVIDTAFESDKELVSTIVASVSGITADNLEDKVEVKKVKEARLALRKVRVAIEKKGKELRDDANKFAKQVIEYEKNLVAVITPEEDRLRDIEDQAEKIAIRKERMASLPARTQALASIGDGLTVDDEVVLDMDDQFFQAYVNKRTAEHNEKVARQLEQKQREIQEQEEQLKRQQDAEKRQKEIEEARESARNEERKRIEEETKRQEEIRQKQEEEARKRADADANLKAWLTSHGYEEEDPDMYLSRNGAEVVLWKKVGTYTIE